MRKTAQAIEKILRVFVDESASVDELNNEVGPSPFLAGRYALYRSDVLWKEVTFAESLDPVDDFGALRRQLDRLNSELAIPHGERVVLFIETFPTSVRRSFLEDGIPFITADGDIFIPFLSFRINAARRGSVTSVRRFKASDRSVFLYGLYAENGFTQADVILATGLSAGSVSRALANLGAARVIDFEIGGRTGRKKTFFKPDDRNYYQLGREFFGDAVLATAFTNKLPEATLYASGLSALALESNLLVPSKEVWAIAPDHMNSIMETEPDLEHGFRYAIQILSYDPAPFALGQKVDPFTMLMTIPEADRSDERVRIALREALKECAWYQD